MAFVALLLALVQFVLVGFGVNLGGASPIEGVSFGLALLALGLMLPRNLPSPPA